MEDNIYLEEFEESESINIVNQTARILFKNVSNKN